MRAVHVFIEISAIWDKKNYLYGVVNGSKIEIKERSAKGVHVYEARDRNDVSMVHIDYNCRSPTRCPARGE